MALSGHPWLNQLPRDLPGLPNQIQIILQPPKFQIRHAALIPPQHLPRPAQFQIRLDDFRQYLPASFKVVGG